MNNKYDITGKNFGYLTVLDRDEASVGERNSRWICRCKCGKITVVPRCALVTGHTSSCGCKMHESHNKIHGYSKTRIYSIWVKMNARCKNPSEKDAKSYKNRGITVCEEWQSDFMAFYEWAMKNGYSDSLTIDRIDNDKGYSPDNCRWITIEEQQSNKRNNVYISYNGKKYCLRRLCENIGFPYKTAHRRYMRLKKRGEVITSEKLLAPIDEKKIAKKYRK